MTNKEKVRQASTSNKPAWPVGRATAGRHHKFATGVVHGVPADLRQALVVDGRARAAWEDITPLARNEWICWIESAKKAETRSRRIDRIRAQLKEGKRRPCCWAGCMHR